MNGCQKYSSGPLDRDDPEGQVMPNDQTISIRTIPVRLKPSSSKIMQPRLLAILTASLGCKTQAAHEFKWMKRAVDSRSGPSLAEMVQRRSCGEPLQYILGSPAKFNFPLTTHFEFHRQSAFWTAQSPYAPACPDTTARD